MIQIHPAGRLKLAILASGRGSNFDAIYQAIQDGRLNADIQVLFSVNSQSMALQKARQRDIPAYFLDPGAFARQTDYEKRNGWPAPEASGGNSGFGWVYALGGPGNAGRVSPSHCQYTSCSIAGF